MQHTDYIYELEIPYGQESYIYLVLVIMALLQKLKQHDPTTRQLPLLQMLKFIFMFIYFCPDSCASVMILKMQLF